jgi:DNA-binding protein Fis
MMNEVIGAFFQFATKSFQFLVDQFGFRNGVRKSEGGLYRVIYQSETTAVEIGLEWREQYIYVELLRLVNGKIKENPVIIELDSELTVFNLEDLIALRAPKTKLSPGFNKRLTIESVKYALTHYARALREFGTDVLKGDLSVFAELEAVVKARISEQSSVQETISAGEATALSKKHSLKDRLDPLVGEMLDRGILFEDAVAEFEKHFILSVLKRTRGNLSRAADELRIHRNTLSKRVEKYYSKSHMKAARGRARAHAEYATDRTAFSAIASSPRKKA